jgi:hypothetical protein
MATAVPGLESPRPKSVVLNFLDPNPARASLLIVRRIKRAMPWLRVGAVIWAMPESLLEDPALARAPSRTAAIAKRELEAIGADFVATTMDEAIAMALSDAAPRPIPEPQKRTPRKLARPRSAVVAA